MNLPSGLSKIVADTLANVIRGVEEISPANLASGAATPVHPPGRGSVGGGSDDAEPPLLRNMQYKGGSYAILMAFHAHAQPGDRLTQDQVERFAQPYCNDPMKRDHWSGRHMNCGWKSKDTLVKHGLISQISMGTSFTGNGFRSNGKNLYELTRAGEAFIDAMLKKWPQDAAAGAYGGGFGGGGGGGGFGGGGGGFGGGGGRGRYNGW